LIQDTGVILQIPSNSFIQVLYRNPILFNIPRRLSIASNKVFAGDNILPYVKLSTSTDQNNQYKNYLIDLGINLNACYGDFMLRGKLHFDRGNVLSQNDWVIDFGIFDYTNSTGTNFPDLQFQIFNSKLGSNPINMDITLGVTSGGELIIKISGVDDSDITTTYINGYRIYLEINECICNKYIDFSKGSIQYNISNISSTTFTASKKYHVTNNATSTQLQRSNVYHVPESVIYISDKSKYIRLINESALSCINLGAPTLLNSL
jgi:hypothetical protein